IVLTVVLGIVYALLFVFRGAHAQLQWSRAQDYAVIAAMTSIAIVLTVVVGSEWAMLFAFVGVPSGLRLPPAQAFWVLWVLVALAGGLSFTDPDIGSDVAATWAATTFGTGLLFISLGQAFSSNRKLRRVQAELAQNAVAEERLRFARD